MTEPQIDRDRPVKNVWDAASLRMSAENCRIRAESLNRLTSCGEDFIWRPADGARGTLLNVAVILESIAESRSQAAPVPDQPRAERERVARLLLSCARDAWFQTGDAPYPGLTPDSWWEKADSEQREHACKTAEMFRDAILRDAAPVVDREGPENLLADLTKLGDNPEHKPQVRAEAARHVETVLTLLPRERQEVGGGLSGFSQEPQQAVGGKCGCGMALAPMSGYRVMCCCGSYYADSAPNTVLVATLPPALQDASFSPDAKRRALNLMSQVNTRDIVAPITIKVESEKALGLDNTTEHPIWAEVGDCLACDGEPETSAAPQDGAGEQEATLHTDWNGPLTGDQRVKYASWGAVPVAVQSAVMAYDAARRAGTLEEPMSERNRISIAGMMTAALIAAGRGIDDVRDEEIRQLRRRVAALSRPPEAAQPAAGEDKYRRALELIAKGRLRMVPEHERHLYGDSVAVSLEPGEAEEVALAALSASTEQGRPG